MKELTLLDLTAIICELQMCDKKKVGRGPCYACNYVFPYFMLTENGFTLVF